MQKLFEVLQELHPGYEVVDVRFLTSRDRATDKTVEELDVDLAAAVRSARPLDLTTLG